MSTPDSLRALVFHSKRPSVTKTFVGCHVRSAPCFEQLFYTNAALSRKGDAGSDRSHSIVDDKLEDAARLLVDISSSAPAAGLQVSLI